jgi:hypothetical protein
MVSTDTVFGFISEFVVGGDGEVGDIGALCASIVLFFILFLFALLLVLCRASYRSGLDSPFSGA